jgi:hypothetical protein
MRRKRSVGVDEDIAEHAKSLAFFDSLASISILILGKIIGGGVKQAKMQYRIYFCTSRLLVPSLNQSIISRWQLLNQRNLALSMIIQAI